MAQSEEDVQAINAWNLLANGMGGVDWAGLPYVVAHLGVHDVDGLVRRLQIIKGYSAPESK